KGTLPSVRQSAPLPTTRSTSTPSSAPSTPSPCAPRRSTDIHPRRQESTMTTTPTTTVRLDEVPGLAGWTASIRPGTVTDPRPILVISDVGAVVQAAERISGLEDAHRTPLIEEDGAQTGVLLD